MNRHRMTLRAALAAFLFLVSPFTAASGVEIVPSENNIKGILEEEARFHLHALQNALQQPKYADFVRDDKLMTSLRDNSVRSTVVRMEYKYRSPTSTQTLTRVYRAKSGRSIEGTVRWIKDRGGKSGVDSTSGSDSSLATDFKDDMDEASFYPRLAANEVRAVVRQPVRNGVSASEPMRARDAELKALREMEVELNRMAVYPGGDLELFVTQPPCSSCTEALTKFANDYKLRSATVYHLTNTTGTPARNWNLSQKASSEFFDSRKALTNSVLGTGSVRPGNVTRREALGFLERVEAVEAGRSTMGKAECVP